MHYLWANLHPEYRHLTAQNLRDQAVVLKRRGFENQAINNMEVPAKLTPEPIYSDINVQIEQLFLENLGENKSTLGGRAIHHKQSITTNTSREINALLIKHVAGNVDLRELSHMVYAAAVTVTSKVKTKPDALRKTEKRINQLKGRIEQRRRETSQQQSFVEAILQGRRFTKKIRKIMQRVKSTHHTVNINILRLIKEQGIDKIRSLCAAKRKLEKIRKRIIQNNLFRINPSAFLKPTKIENTRLNIGDAERYWSGLWGASAPTDSTNSY
ncbi:hypothetical protein Trydic_g1783 [Trypoxylus dichotomus]